MADGNESRLERIQKDITVLEGRQEGHEKECLVRYDGINKSLGYIKETVDAIHNSTNRRIDDLEKVRWSTSAKITGLLVSLLIMMAGGLFTMFWDKVQ